MKKEKITIWPLQVVLLDAIFNFEARGVICPIMETYLSSLSENQNAAADTEKPEPME